MSLIRRLQINDIEIAKELFLFFQTDDGIATPRVASSERLEELLADDNFCILVAFADGKLIGGLTAYVLKMYKRNSIKVMLYEIGVKPKYRRKGVGRKLVENLKTLSAEQNAEEILIPTTANNRNGKEFYKATGGILSADSVTYKYILEKNISHDNLKV